MECLLRSFRLRRKRCSGALTGGVSAAAQTPLLALGVPFLLCNTPPTTTYLAPAPNSTTLSINIIIIIILYLINEKLVNKKFIFKII